MALPRIVPLTPIDLDKPRHLLFTREAVFTIGDLLTQLTGQEMTFLSGLFELDEARQDLKTILAYSLRKLSIYLWQGLRHEDPTLTLEQVQDAMPYTDAVGLFALMQKVIDAWNATSPTLAPGQEPAPGGTEDVAPLAASTGNDSGVLNGLASASVSVSSGV
jgi:hypothetical protein